MGRLHLGTILGTTIAIDFSFVILMAFWVFSRADVDGMPQALIWAPVLFISILVHEFAHAAMIGAFGFGGSEIVLEGLGGVTINGRKAKPWQDMLISAAGPASSFALSYGFAFLFFRIPFLQTDPFFVALIPSLVWANKLWGIFNLMPVMPLDGSGVLRNFLQMFLDDKLAFVIAVWVSMIVGVALAILGMVSRQIFLALLMLWFVRSSFLQWQLYRSFNRPGD